MWMVGELPAAQTSGSVNQPCLKKKNMACGARATLVAAFDACNPEGQEYLLNLAVTVAALMPAVRPPAPAHPPGWQKPDAVVVRWVSRPA